MIGYRHSAQMRPSGMPGNARVTRSLARTRRAESVITSYSIHYTKLYEVHCVPPQNKPTPAEANTCRPFLETEIRTNPNLTAMIALGAIAHTAVLGILGVRKAAYPFGHGHVHAIPGGPALIDSYHCSRYNSYNFV